jgi:hypothetical protein
VERVDSYKKKVSSYFRLRVSGEKAVVGTQLEKILGAESESERGREGERAKNRFGRPSSEMDSRLSPE